MNLAMLKALFPFFAFLLFFSLFLIPNIKKCEMLKKLSSFANGKLGPFSFYSPCFKGEFEGFNFSVTLFMPSKSTPAYLHLSFFKPSSFTLKIHRETFSSEFGQKLGLVREVKTGDAEFDRQFFIQSNDPTLAVNYLHRDAAKEAIRGFFNYGFDCFTLDGKKILITQPYNNLEQSTDAQRIKGILQKMTLLAQDLH
jgi:hypothetical protein